MNGQGTSGERFLGWLQDLKGKASWRAARAALRRSLAFDPGAYPPAMPYVEPFFRGTGDEGWRRQAYYLVAGLYALRDGEHRGGRSLAQALYEVRQKRGSESVEKRFLALLDADRDQIAYRLRQAVLLVEGPLDFARLLDDLMGWFHASRRVQARWAREFYGTGQGKEEAALEGQASGNKEEVTE
ncbi:type I-E CRISPR-associated protein Cse2/CasB [uncultured Thermus sp.]|uniref:type I-E CRISPR-associated protein Cse2/CasB n=1 Tax=uncultured Thermus sp. TaxID=157149 RepID=UPI002607E281|nr:type I-E CRISPR-associated protein Cse2/CasB [uncultured Thermus sp.]